jgi:CRISPR/Cas system-associated endonuclease Cas1
VIGSIGWIQGYRPALDLFSRGILNQEHFEPKNEGIYLNHQGRNKLILQYEKRLERHFHSEHIGQRTTLRIQLQSAPLNFKIHLNEQSSFKPFRMN